jgi:phosphatidylglycerophosphate synthase
MPPHTTIADVIRGYNAAKARDEWYGEWGAAIFYRPIAFLITPALLRLSIGATAITLTALAIALSLPVIALSGTRSAAVAIALLGILFGILDCVDGNIARATGTASRFGHYLDFVTDVVFRMSLYAALGLVADRLAVGPVGLSGNAFALAAIAALLAVGARLCRIYSELMTGKKANERPNEVAAGSAMTLYVFPFISGLDSLTSAAMLAAVYLGLLGWLVLWLVAYSAVDFLYSQYDILSRLK